MVQNVEDPDPHYNPPGPSIFDGSKHLYSPPFGNDIKSKFGKGTGSPFKKAPHGNLGSVFNTIDDLNEDHGGGRYGLVFRRAEQNTLLS